MVPSSVGAVVLLPFPFTDLSQSRLRPAVVLANVGRGDWVLCQITSNAYADTQAVELTSSDFASGSLRLTSYARTGKLFTANNSLIVSQVGVLNAVTQNQVVDAVIDLLRPSASST